MEFGAKLWREHRWAVITALGALVNIIAFAFLFTFHPTNDTDSFIATIERFRGLDSPMFPSRYLNPLYPILGATIFRWLSPAGALITTNLLFYVGLTCVTFGLIKRVWRDERVAALSTLLVLSAYPMVRYALAQVQDIGGYFFFVATAYAAWRWYEDGRAKWLWLVGLSVGLGMLTKESGAMSALFAGMIVFFRETGWTARFKTWVQMGIVPVIVLVLNQWHGHQIHYTSGQWYMDNWRLYAAENYTLFRFAGVNATAFNLVWLPFAAGLLLLKKQWAAIDTRVKVYLAAIIIPSLSYFAWPLFIGRTVFISAWIIFPIAAWAMVRWFDTAKYRTLAVISMVALLAAPYILQHTLRYTHFFPLIEKCGRNPICVWETFWQERPNTSKFL